MKSKSEENTRQQRANTRQPRQLVHPQDGQPFDPLAYAHYEEPEPALIRNPYVLAGIAVFASVFLAIVVVILFGGSNGEGSSIDATGNGNPNVLVDPLTPQANRGVTARSISPATVREGPASSFGEIAPLRTGQDVEVIGRDAQSSWYQIYYPVGSQLKGWVVASALKMPDGSNDCLAITVATPLPRPTIAVPTPLPESPTLVPSPSVSPTPAGGPDLAISITSCQAGLGIVVTIRNAGQVAAKERQVRVTITSGAGVIGVADSLISVEPGVAVSISTSQPAQAGLMMARVDLIGAPPDANPTNNSAQCSGAAMAPQPGGVPATPPLPPQPGR